MGRNTTPAGYMAILAWYVLSARNRRWSGVLMMSKTMMSAARNAMSAPIWASESPRPPRAGGVKAYKGYSAKNVFDMGVMRNVLVRIERTCDVKQEWYETRSGSVDACGSLHSALVHAELGNESSSSLGGRV